MSQENITFPALDFDAAQTFLENERDGTPSSDTYSRHLRKFFSRLDYKQLCLLLKMTDTKMTDCRQEANRLVQKGILAGDVDVTKVQESDVAEESLDEFGKYVVSNSAGIPEEDTEGALYDRHPSDGPGFLVLPRNWIKLGVFSSEETLDGTPRRRRFTARKRDSSEEVCATLEAHSWQLPEAEKLYHEALVFGFLKSRCVEVLQAKFTSHHTDLGAKVALEAVKELLEGV